MWDGMLHGLCDGVPMGWNLDAVLLLCGLVRHGWVRGMVVRCMA